MSETPKSSLPEKINDDEKENLIKKLIQLKQEEAKLDELIAKLELAEVEKKEYIDALHEYNDIKDATQTVLGALATLEGVTVTEIHKRFNLPLSEQDEQ